MPACVACGEELDERARFCPACGTAVQPAGAPREERKVVSILFVDLVGSTAAADGQDPEVVRDLLRGYHGRVKDELERFGATVEKFIGDAVMAVFGAPHAHTDDAERAVRAGLRALTAVSGLATASGAALVARAAVATGEVVVPVDADARSGEALAIGDVVNVASRLQSAAPEGALVVDEPTMRATRRNVRYHPLGPVAAKGKTDPLMTWVAEDVGAPGGVLRRGPAPLVGRDGELSQLLTTWERVVEQGRPSLVAVVGAAGAGKSRLAAEFAGRVDARVVTGRCVPFEQADVYGAFAQQVKQLAGIAELDRREIAVAKLDNLVESVVPEAERADVRRCAAVLLGAATEEPVVGEPTVLLYAFRRLLESVATQTPTVFVFEDVHWAEGAEYDLIRYLAQYVRDVPAMFVVLTRPDLLETRPDWSHGLLNYSTLALEALADSDARTIVEAVAGDAVDGDVLARLVETGAGNPLFLEELATAVVERPGAAGDLPTNIHSAIAARVDSLPTEARTALLNASVVGRTFWVGALSACVDADVAAALDVLEQRDLVRRQPTSLVPGDVEFRIKHALIRDVCYGTLPRGDRARAHAAVATYLEQRVGDSGDLAWLLGHHFEQAGAAVDAIRCLLVAADRAKAAYAPAEAIALLDRAERLAPDEAARVTIRLARGRTLTLFEEYDAGYETLQPLLAVLEGADLVDALIDFARCCHWTERTDEVIQVAQQAAALATEIGMPEAVAPALGRLSQGYSMRGQEGDLARSLEVGEQALATWAPDVRIQDRAEHEYLLGHVYHWVGDDERALALARRARETAVDDPASVEARLRGIGMDGILLAGLGAYDEAMTKFADALTLAEDMGRPRRVLMNYSTQAFRELLDLDEARRRSEWVLDGIPQSTFHMPWMNAEADLLHVDVLAGEWGAAMMRWERFYPLVMGTPAWERWLLGTKLEVFRAEIALHTGDAADALEWGMRALTHIRSSSRVKYEPLALDVVARAQARVGNAQDAVRSLTSASTLADKLGNPHVRLLTHAHAARTLHDLGMDDEAANHHGAATDIVASVAAGLAPEHAKTYRTAAAQLVEV